ncbi:hypothetical protein J3A64_000207 [Pseudarthrobacter sp. PvP004]|nr:hypothetical protein [Pseudarthrobacter sp. PvP004]
MGRFSRSDVGERSVAAVKRERRSRGLTESWSVVDSNKLFVEPIGGALALHVVLELRD